MKKFLLVITCLFFVASNVQAKALKVEAAQDFSTKHPSKFFQVKILESDYLDDGTYLPAGAIVSGYVSDIQPPKRLKRDSYFEFIPDKITIEGKTNIIKEPDTIAKVIDYEPLNKKQLALNAARTAAGFALRGATQGIAFVQGAAKNEEGNRIKSGLVNVYEASPISYIQKGEELELKTGDSIVIIVKEIDSQY